MKASVINKIIKQAAIVFTALSLLSACAEKPANNSNMISDKPATVYFGGDILTMVGDKPNYVEAVVTQQGKIVFVGDKSAAISNYPAQLTQVDLQGKTLMPGFIEPHVHPSIAAIILGGDIIAPHDWDVPDGLKKGVSGHEAYIKQLAVSIEKNSKAGQVYFVWGYHQLWHGELNRALLNKISPDKPVAVIHRSFHEVFINDKAIEVFKLKATDFKDNPQVDWEKGHFFEGGWLTLVPKIAPQLLNAEHYKKGLADMTHIIRKNGVTTVAEQGFPASNFSMEYTLLKNEMAKKPPYDVYNVFNGTQLYSVHGKSNEKAEQWVAQAGKYDTDNIKMLPKQIKLYADGAIYSLAMQMKDGYRDGFKGQWMTPPALFEQQMNFYWDKGYKINIHANGDLGIQLCLDIVEKMMTKNPRVNHRLTLHHVGYFTDEQADQMQRLGIEASANPYYLWALSDKYSEYGLGKERATNLVHMKSLKERNIPFSLHSDFGMAPLSPLTLAWTAVNRMTSEHTLVSQDQRISAHTAMQAITINAARTLELEKTMGSIEMGKVANFTLLAENPLKVKPMQIKDIKVFGVVYHGQMNLVK
jgi:predicted amidohydrolase YtcJ